MSNPLTIATREEYNKYAALNCSAAKHLLVSPAHYKHYMTAEREETKALRMGSLTHALVLEPEVVQSRFAFLPEGIDRRTSAGKLAYSAFEAAAMGKTIVNADEANDCRAFAAALEKTIKEVLKVTFTATELMLAVDYCGARLKSAIDAVGSDGFLYDLKTAESADPKKWLYSAKDYRFPLQAHFYRTVYQAATGERVKGFRFIVVEKSPPYAVAIYEFGPELMTYAAMDFEKAVSDYKTYTGLDEWPGYPTEVQFLDINSPAHASVPIQFA